MWRGKILGIFLISPILPIVDASNETNFVQDIKEFQSGGNVEGQEPFSFYESELILIDAKRTQSNRNAPPTDITGDSFAETWQAMSEKYLCSSQNASVIRDALNQAFPGFVWYVLVQDYQNGYVVSYRGDFHNVTNMCQKNMFVWRGKAAAGCTEAAQNATQFLLDLITSNSDESGTIMDTILEGEAVFGLDHYITASWDTVSGSTEVAALLIPSCYAASKNKANYYILKYEPTTPTPTTSRTTEHSTLSPTTPTPTTSRTTEHSTLSPTTPTPTTSRTTEHSTLSPTTPTPTTSRTTEHSTLSPTPAVPWEDVADSYLCSSGHASTILDALDISYPGMDWYVFVQDTQSNWTGSMPRGESHRAENLCGKNMVVWRQPPTGITCSEDSAASAQSLINNATGSLDQAEAIQEYIINGEAEYGLSHDMTASWDDLSTVTDWASKVEFSCHVNNNRTMYYISTSSASVGPNTLLGHTFCILITTVLAVVAI